ncbi:MAG: NAD(P)/FAD-dependent oxidoreductase [Dehalogenimonas sp.]|uniref:NAD(P)/FAD-dependent oxidoreductase n=1 Tax=Candidatus Dehalogenimonas loeffleri TaxID=3127115 RepID=A0ABZ2J3C5_9CHLR|nr:NAD(P)/FAD-dependent oxidoreductase [Dehalogenimonas sp.]
MDSVELLIIGGGTAGETAAGKAIGAVNSIAVVEQDRVGGDCVYNACIPTKVLVHAARVYKRMNNAAFFGLPDADVRADYAKVKAAKDDFINNISQGRDRKLEAKGVRLYRGQARFRSPHEVEVGDTLIRADKIIITTGSAPSVPPIPGLAETGYLTNVTALQLEQIPERIAIIGGGAVGVEFAQIFNAFGGQVHIIESADRLLANEDADISSTARVLFEKAGIKVSAAVKISKIETTASGKLISGVDGKGQEFQEVFSEILVATGRRPVLDDLNLKDAGVDFTRKGIMVNDNLRTSAGHIWAAGDVTGIALYTFVAWEQGGVAVENALNNSGRSLNYDILPHATFSDPEIAGVGLTEQAAKEQGFKVSTGTFNYADLTRAMAADETEGFIKIIAESGTGRILGGHIIGNEASSLIHEVAAAMIRKATIQDIGGTFHAFPTLSEGVRYACQAAQG